MTEDGGANPETGAPVCLEAAMAPAVVVTDDTPLRDVAALMLERQVISVVVVDRSGAVRGMVSDRHLTLDQRWLRLSAVKVPRLHGRWVTRKDEVEAACVAAGTVTAREMMDHRVTTATWTEPVSTVVDRMLRRDAECAVVLRAAEVIGVLGRRELLRLVAGQPRAQQPEAVSPATVHPSTAHLALHAGGHGWTWLFQVWR